MSINRFQFSRSEPKIISFAVGFFGRPSLYRMSFKWKTVKSHEWRQRVERSFLKIRGSL